MAGRRRDAVADALRDRIVTGLHVGRLRGGERLPSTRALAAEFEVNERVVLAALRVLVDEGFIDLRERSGAYVLPPDGAKGSTLPELGAWLVSMLLQARARGLPPRLLAEYIQRRTANRRVRAACIECNDDQRHLLCTELAEDHGFTTEPLELDDLESPASLRALQRVEVLVTTMFHAGAVRAIAQRLGKPCIAVALRPDFMRDVARRLREGPVYYVATDPRFEAKVRRMFRALGPTDNLRVVLLGRDDPRQIPADAPTFVMTSARAGLAEVVGPAGAGQPIHPPRQLSDASARDLLTFLVQANTNEPRAASRTRKL